MPTFPANHPLAQFLASSLEEGPDGNEPMAELNAEARAEYLKELLASYQAQHEFKVGDLIQWKSGLRNKRFPAYGAPVIVVESHPGRVNTVGEPSSSYFSERLDLTIATIDGDGDGDFMFYTVDSARFEPFTAGGAK